MPLSSTSSPAAGAAAAAAVRTASGPRRVATQVLFRQKLGFLGAFQAQHVKCSPHLFIPNAKGARSDITDDDNGTTEPARELLERLFAKTKSLDPGASQDRELSMSIEVLKTEFESALSILRKKERDLRDAEKKVSVDRSRLNQTKQDLDQREEDIIKAYSRQHEMEKALMKASRDLTLQVRHINKLKVMVEEQDKKIVSSQDALSKKVIEVDKLKQEMLKKNDEAALLRSEIESKEQELLAANQAIARQEAAIRELQSETKRKQTEIQRLNELTKANEEKLKVTEQELEKQNSGWIAAQQELKELAQMAFKDKDNIKNTINDFKRVRYLLDAVRSELIASKEAFTFSRKQVEDQAAQLSNQVQELTDQKTLIISYTQNLEAAQLEIQGKTNELSAVQSRCSELESQLLEETNKVESLESMLTKERESLEQKTKEVELLQEELVQKEKDYFNSLKLVETKETELLEARQEVEDMKLMVDSIQFAVQEKDLELLEAQRKLDAVNSEVVELQHLINSKEDQLVQVRTELQDKEQCIQLMKDELDKMRLGRLQAESVVQKIVELTGNLIGSVEGEEFDIYNLLDDEILSTSTALESNLRRHNQLQADIDMLKESLRRKDMDLNAAYKALDSKDRELRAVVGRLDVRDKELDKLEELSIDPYDIRRLSSVSDEATKDNIVGEVELQKHEMESVEIEALAASAMLKKLANVTKEFLRSGRTDFGTNLVSPRNPNISEGASKSGPQRKINVILEAKKEIVGLFSLTEKLITGAQMKDAEEP